MHMTKALKIGKYQTKIRHTMITFMLFDIQSTNTWITLHTNTVTILI